MLKTLTFDPKYIYRVLANDAKNQLRDPDSFAIEMRISQASALWNNPPARDAPTIDRLLSILKTNKPLLELNLQSSLILKQLFNLQVSEVVMQNIDLLIPLAQSSRSKSFAAFGMVALVTFLTQNSVANADRISALQSLPSTLTVLMEMPMDTGSPAISNAPLKIALSDVMDTLTSFDHQNKSDGFGLATRWDVSKDAKTYTFHLKSGIHWHSSPRGFKPTRDFNAMDVVYTFQRFMDPRHPLHETPLAHGNFSYWRFDGLDDLIANVIAKDARTVIFQLKKPSAILAEVLSQFAFVINSAEYGEWCVRQFQDAQANAKQTGQLPSWEGKPLLNPLSWFDQELIGTGARAIVKRDTETGTLLTESVHPVRKGEFQRVLFIPEPNADRRVEKIKTGDAQIAMNPDPSAVEDLIHQGVAIQEAKTKNLAFLVFNPSISTDARRAISMSIDREKILRDLFGGRGRVSGSVIDFTLLPKEYQRPEAFEHHLDRARKLVKDEVPVQDRKLTLIYPPTTKSYIPRPAAYAAALKMDIEAAGFTVRTATVGYRKSASAKTPTLIYDDTPDGDLIAQAGMYSRRLMDGGLPGEVVLAGDGNTTALGLDRLLNALKRGIASQPGAPATNYTGWSSDLYDEVVDKINGERNIKRRSQLLVVAEKLMWSGGLPLVPLTQTDVRYIISGQIEGFRGNGMSQLRTSDVRLKDASHEVR